MSKYNRIVTGNENTDMPMIHQARIRGTDYLIDYDLIGNAPVFYRRELGPYIEENVKFSGTSWQEEFPTIDKALYAGDSYIVTLDGTDYECTACAEEGDENEAEIMVDGVFSIRSELGNGLYFYFEQEPAYQYHTLSIRRILEARKLLDEELLPILYRDGKTAESMRKAITWQSLSELSFTVEAEEDQWEHWDDNLWYYPLTQHSAMVNRYNLMAFFGLLKGEMGETIDYEDFAEEFACAAVFSSQDSEGEVYAGLADGPCLFARGEEPPGFVYGKATVIFTNKEETEDWHTSEPLPSTYVIPEVPDLKTVRYYSDGRLILVERVVTGNYLTAEEFLDPKKPASGGRRYYFSGWSLDGSTIIDLYHLPVTEDMELYAVFTEAARRQYTITWKNSDNSVLKTESCYEGEYPVYGYETDPETGDSREAVPVDPYGGTFDKWDPEIVPAYADATYKATYLYDYQVRFIDGTEILHVVTGVQRNESVSFPGICPRREGKRFDCWNPSPDNVTGNMDCYAKYTPVFVPISRSAEDAYGVEWNYAETSPDLTRKGLSYRFSDPSPATSLEGSGSSPFDSIMPWAGMKRYNVINGVVSCSEDDAEFSETDYDTVVYIPEFWYTAYRDNENRKWLWAISPKEKDGYAKHPGSGRYVGRFKLSGSSSAVFTKSGVLPYTGSQLHQMREYCHNKGDGWGMLDYETWSAIQLLYLVEFASFHSQQKLGSGGSSAVSGISSPVNTGASTGAAYHTVNAETFNQYRWIENPFSNVGEIIDGLIAGTMNSDDYSQISVYAAPDTREAYADMKAAGSGLGPLYDKVCVNVGFYAPRNRNQVITGFGYSEKCPFAFIPNGSGGTDYDLNATDVFSASSGYTYPYVGWAGDTEAVKSGLFTWKLINPGTSTGTSIGGRLVFKPKN